MKKKLLLHVCCAPCSSYVLSILNNIYDISIYFYNPNIEPYEEFNKRYIELKNFIKNNYPNIKIYIDDYYNNDFKNISYGLEKEPEKGKRCLNCYKMRLERTALKAIAVNADIFTSTLSVSPYKNSNWLNEIGKELENKYNIKYLESDFKKNDGYKKSIELSKKYDLYRQNYCGCIYSKKDII
ncbi:MAG: epoxyqueuosine reductase QueH [Bacilli bacterium]